ncbi:MAG TPA: hypothetical protein VHC49_22470 [Mycobacteriales bacterium]|nr:hypothetical protein [Mycobacteriales bacterium]
MLTTTGRGLRALIAGAALALTLAGTVWGQDRAFPFGPFRMADDPARSPRVEGLTSDGRRLVITGGTGLRAAEVEGQLHRFEAHPQLLGPLADAYQRRHHGTRLVAVEIVAPDHSRPAVLARWERP